MIKYRNVILHLLLVLTIFSSLLKGHCMYQNKDPVESDFLFGRSHNGFGSLEPDEEFLKLEEEIRRRNLLYTSDIKWLMDKAALGPEENILWVKQQLKMILESERIMDMRTGDVFRPLAPKELLSQGDLVLFNQVDGTPWKVPLDTLTRGMLLTGPQGGGKTRFLISICRQLADAGIPFFICDPKGGLKEWANYLDAECIDTDNISIDLSPPPGLTYEKFLIALMPQIGEIIGSIYGIEIAQQAAQICITQRKEYFDKTGIKTEICLQDILTAIAFVSNTSSGRRAGYKDALVTGFSRIITGSGNLFKCRKGVDLNTLFNSRVILGCRSITDDFAVKFLGLFLLNHLYESGRYLPASDKLKRVLVLDDASRFLANPAGSDFTAKTSSFTNIYSCLRSSGNGVITTTQVPHMADPGVIALSHSIINVGALHYEKDTKLLAQMMTLNEEQQIAVSRLANREAIGISAGTAWPKVVHGYTVDVPEVK